MESLPPLDLGEYWVGWGEIRPLLHPSMKCLVLSFEQLLHLSTHPWFLIWIDLNSLFQQYRVHTKVCVLSHGVSQLRDTAARVIKTVPHCTLKEATQFFNSLIIPQTYSFFLNFFCLQQLFIVGKEVDNIMIRHT